MNPTEEDYAVVRDRVMQDAAAEREREAAYRLDRLAIDLAAAEGITKAAAYDRVLQQPEGLRALAEVRQAQGRDGDTVLLRKAAEVLETQASAVTKANWASTNAAVAEAQASDPDGESDDEVAAAELIEWGTKRLAKAEGISKAEASERLLSSPHGMRMRGVLERARGNDADAARWIAAAADVEQYESVRADLNGSR